MESELGELSGPPGWISREPAVHLLEVVAELSLQDVVEQSGCGSGRRRVEQRIAPEQPRAFAAKD
jgi:hypothetical protein